MRKLFTIAMIGAALALSGCGKKDEKTVYSDNKGNSVATNASGDHMTFTGSNGEKMEIGTGTNAKLPAYLAVYPGASVAANINTNNADGTGGMVSLKTSAAPADVIAFYKQKAQAHGMKESMNADMNGTMTFAAANDAAKEQLAVSAAKDSDGTTVSITWSAGKK